MSTFENCLRTCTRMAQLKGDSHPHSPKTQTQTQPQNTNALGDVTNGSEEEMCQSLCCPGDTAVSVPSPTVSCQAATCKFRLHGQLLFFFPGPVWPLIQKLHVNEHCLFAVSRRLVEAWQGAAIPNLANWLSGSASSTGDTDTHSPRMYAVHRRKATRENGVG